MRVVLLGSNQLLYYGSQILAKVLVYIQCFSEWCSHNEVVDQFFLLILSNVVAKINPSKS